MSNYDDTLPEDAEKSSLDTFERELLGLLEDTHLEGSPEVSGIQPAMALGEGRYEVVRKLGQGGMGAVYEVEDTLLGTTCALKTMTGDRTASIMRFKREFRTVAGLRHPNLIKLFDLTTEGNLWFYTMELVAGDVFRTLTEDSETFMACRSELIERASTIQAPFYEVWSPRTSTEAKGRPATRCDLEALPTVLAQLLDALAFLHSRGIVHRDLKTDNILVRSEGTVCLLDFGIVKNTDDIPHTGSTGTILGTVAYMAPEQGAGERITPATDIYALGCILFEILTGSVPFSGDLIHEVIFAHQLQAPPRVSDLVSGVPEALVEICWATMAKDPDDRPTLDEIRTRLALDEFPSLLPRATRDERPQPTRPLHEAHAAIERSLALTDAPRTLFIEADEEATQLADIASTEARQRGSLVFRARCSRREALPYQAFDEIIDGIALLISKWDHPRLEAIDHLLDAVAAVFPAFGIINRPHKASPPASDDNPPHPLAFEHLRQIFDTIQTATGLTLVIEDLQWMDSESASLLEALLEARGSRFALVATYRPGELAQNNPFIEVLASWSHLTNSFPS